MPIPIVDSHIHLFPESHLPTFAWYSPSSPLGFQHSIDEYRTATSEPSYLRGFIVLETDRISSQQSGAGWTHVLDEVSFFTRIALGEPMAGEGHRDVDKPLCLGIIPWAPVPGGPETLEKFMALVKERTKTEDVWRKVRGVRYLVQDKPAGVMLEQDFVDGLKWLGRNRLVFDHGVDARQGGLWQLRETIEMMEKAYGGVQESERVVIGINHLCKPNLRLPYTSPDSITTHPEFLEWKSLITAMAQYPTSYMKLSGGFSELPTLSASPEPDISALVDRIQPWTDAVFDAFTPERVMFGSDWPVCNMGGGGNDASWRRWRNMIEIVLDRRGLNDVQRKGVWGSVAIKAYGVEI